MTKPFDGSDNPLAQAIVAIINKTIEMGIACEDTEVLDALAWVYASLQRYNDGTRPHKLN